MSNEKIFARNKTAGRGLFAGALFVAMNLFAPPGLAATHFHVDVSLHNEAKEANAKAPPDTKSSLDVTLVDQYFSVKSQAVTIIFDFKKRQRIVIDNDRRTYVDYSLFDTVGFRTLEFDNRKMISGALAAAKVDTISSDLVDVEHELSVQGGSLAKLEEDVGEEGFVMSSGKRRLARWSQAGSRVDSETAARFAKLLRYMWGGHPQILDRIAGGALIPNELTLTFSELGWDKTVSMSIKEVQQSGQPPAYDLSAYARRRLTLPANEIDVLLDASANLSRDAVNAAKDAQRQAIAKALQDGRILDAGLGIVEWDLMGGEPSLVHSFSREEMMQIQNDAAVQQLSTAMEAKTKEARTEAVKTLVSLRAGAPKKSYVLKIFEANYRNPLGDRALAQKLMVEA